MQNVTLADGTVIRDLDNHEERVEAVRIQQETWGEGFSESVPAAMLMVAQKTGGVAAAAFAPDGRMLGFVFGITGVQDGRLVHWSDMLAVRSDARGRGLGERLKWYQRDRCREIGVETMFWTFDPFVARNAHLNLARLGAYVHEFVEDMYGADTRSRVHALGTDRFVAAWAVASDVVPGALTQADFTSALLVVGAAVGVRPDAIPTASGAVSDAPLPDAAAVAVAVPLDHLAAIAQDARATRDWYLAARRAFGHYLRRGYRVRGFLRYAGDGRYLLTRNA